MWACITDFPVVTLLTVSFMFICAYIHNTPFLYTYAWYARHLALPYVLPGLHLTTLDFHVQILEPRSWWPYCSWSERAADPPVVVRAQQSLDVVVALRPSSSLVWLPRPSCYSWVSLSFCYVYLSVLCTFVSSGDVIFLKYCITLCDNYVLILFC